MKLKIAFELLTELNLADTWRDDDEIVRNRIMVFNTFDDAMKMCSKLVTEPSSRPRLVHGKILWTRNYGSYSSTYVIRPIFEEDLEDNK